VARAATVSDAMGSRHGHPGPRTYRRNRAKTADIAGDEERPLVDRELLQGVLGNVCNFTDAFPGHDGLASSCNVPRRPEAREPAFRLLPSRGTRNGIVAGPPFVRSKIAICPRRLTFPRSASASPYQACDCRDALLA